MGVRKSYEYINKLKNKFGVEVIYSWSRYNRYKNDPYGYMLNYIKHIPETKKDSIWGESGGICHDILERFYLKEISYEDMLIEYESKLFEMQTKELKYNRTDNESNDKIATKYEDSIRHFFTHYKPLDSKVILEQFVTINVGRFYFQGYIDFLHKIGEDYIIEDFKTSTIYTGKKKISEAGQLILYAESLIQRGISLNKIKIRWNFLKYCTVISDLKTIDKNTKLNKTKSKNCVRTQWVKDSEKNISKWLEIEGYDELEITDMIQTSIENNNIDNLPQSIQNRFKVEDCYVYVDLTQELIDELREEIISTLEEVESKTSRAKELIKEIDLLGDNIKVKDIKKAKENELDEMFWTTIDRSKEYFFYNLCGYTRQQHRCWDEYLKETMMFVEDNFDKEFENNTDSEFDWLNDI